MAWPVRQPIGSAERIMKQVMSLPAPRRDRAPMSASPKQQRRSASGPEASDPRWSLLNLVRTCRDRLGLRDRDITVLRGLLSLVPGSAQPHERVVFASNRVLIERCDGIDERTLRRRLESLQTHGLLVRRASPNGKRYQLRADGADITLTYGIDLGPLFTIRDHLQALAEQCRQEVLHCKALRGVIRDILFHHGPSLPPDMAQAAYRCLRRALSSEQLQSIVDGLHAQRLATAAQDVCETQILTVSDSQNDRHIQRSNTEYLDSEWVAQKDDVAQTPDELGVEAGVEAEDITLQECLNLAPNAAAFASAPTRTWEDVVALSQQLAPAIGLEPHAVETARRSMGGLGSALAVIGLVEAFGRIRNPQAYMHSLVKRAQIGGFDPVKMFRSLTRPQRAVAA